MEDNKNPRTAGAGTKRSLTKGERRPFPASDVSRAIGFAAINEREEANDGC